ncbi:hypothetical protein [Aquimarina longa]|uniref:hypothetical protein n=1 Tax=Aquimarina longa TaxID=1080221 RepID=UPI0007865F14|nr:hypothetical protein [Aquimarina longa]
MKKITAFLSILLALTFVGCSSDDDSNTNTNKDLSSALPDPQEETELDANKVSKDIKIRGAKKIEAAAPTPTGTLAFNLDKTDQSAFLNSGFDIEFNAPQNYKGAYLQVLSKDGSPASEYFDIPSNFYSSSSSKTLLNKSAKTEEDENDYRIEVNFGAKIAPGKFCYAICIYDEDGNISQPIQVCVEVEAWGGNTNFIGTWNYKKQIKDNTTTINAGEENCDDYEYTINCNNESTLTINKDYCYITNTLPITFNADGTYEYTSNGTNTRIDYEKTRSTCTPTFTAVKNDSYYSKGYWAYDEEEKKLTLVEFEYKDDNGNGDISEGTNEDGELVFDGKITLTNSDFTLTESYNDGNDNEVETYQYFFSK